MDFKPIEKDNDDVPTYLLHGTNERIHEEKVAATVAMQPRATGWTLARNRVLNKSKD